LVGSVEVLVGAREFGLLATLASDPDRVFTKQELMKKVWGYDAIPTSRTLESHASRVRVKLRAAGADGYVINCKSVGYRLWNTPA
jgi:DNA-binding response OmpR family regulator